MKWVLWRKESVVYNLTKFCLNAYGDHFKLWTRSLRITVRSSFDVLRTRNDIPIELKEKIIHEYLTTSDLNGIFNTSHLTSFTAPKKFIDLIVEVLKVLDIAEKEIYFATGYHDPYVSTKVFEKYGRGDTINILDGKCHGYC